MPLITTVQPSLPIAPPGWTIEPLSDGSLQFQPSGWRRFFDRATLPVCFLLFGIILLGPEGTRSHHALQPQQTLLWHGLGALVLLLAVGAAIWQFGAKEVLRVRHGFLERTLTLGPIHRCWRFENAAEFRIETRQGSDRNGTYTNRRLLIENLGQRVTLDHRSRRDSLFFLSVHAPVVADDISALGRCLSDLTGWRLLDPELGRY